MTDTFTHTPRPPAYAGASRIFGSRLPMRSADPLESVQVYRYPDLGVAHMQIAVPAGELTVSMKPNGLRELARSLIDAAADIEREAS